MLNFATYGAPQSLDPCQSGALSMAQKADCRRIQRKRNRTAAESARLRRYQGMAAQGGPLSPQRASTTSRGLPGLSAQSGGLPGVASTPSSSASRKWSPLRTFQGVSPSPRNNKVVSGAYEFFRDRGMSSDAAITRALQAVRVPSRWRAHYRKYLTDKYGGGVMQIRRPIRVKKRPLRPRFQASVSSEAPTTVAEPLAEYAPGAATEPSIVTPEGMEDVIYEDELSPPFYRSPVFLATAAGLLGATVFYFARKKGK